MAQQTAVEWFYQRILANDIEAVYQQAKEMEKQQIEAAYKNGDGEHDEVAYKLAKQYYTKTYTNETR
jgi:glutamyl-tRNA reductase